MSLKSDLLAGLQAERRLQLLRLLREADTAAFTLNEVVLQNQLALAGHAVAVDALRDDLRHLRDHDCLRLDTGAGVWLATLTRNGSDTAAGTRPVEGVAHPTPGA